MNFAGNNETFEGSNSRPFFYVPPMTQQPHLGPWYQNATYNPLSIPGAGFTNGSLYFPYAVVFNEYPGFLVPLSPLPTALNRRPIVPLYYNTAPFRQCGGYWEKMKTKDTQTETEPQQAENLNEKQDTYSEGDNCDVGRVTSVPTDTLKETMPSYDVAYGKAMPGNEVQYNGISHSSCESRGMLYDPHEGKGLMNLSEERKGYAVDSQIPPLPNAVKDRDVSQNTLNSKLYQSVGNINKLQQEKPPCASMEAVKHLNLHSESQKPLTVGKSMPENSSGSHGSPENVGEEEEVESNSYPEGGASSPNLLAQVNKVDEAIQCDMSWWCEVQSENSHELSPESTREGAEQMGCRDEVETNSPEGHTYPSTWLAQFNKVDESNQCDMSWFESQVRKSPQQMLSRGEEASPDCRAKASWEKLVTNRKLSADKEVLMNDEIGEVYNENFKTCATIKTVRGRKLKDLSTFSNVKTVCLLKKSAALNIVIPEDSGDSELEEEEDEMDEVECLLEEVSLQSPLKASKGRSYQEAGRMLRVPPESAVPTQLIVWPTRNKYKLKHGECECVPVFYQLKRQDGCEGSGDRLRSKHTMARLEGVAPRRASHKCK
uniref:Bucky ball n=2 Tax=Sus scrofa TaxID=9823 RepID=A0A8D1LYM6_PIG